MPTTITFSLDLHLQSTHAHQIRPILPNIFADYDIHRTITINKISSTNPKRLEKKQDFLLITPTIANTCLPLNFDIQSKLESVIFKTVDCEILDLYNQIKSKPTTTAFNDNLAVILSKFISSEHKYFFGNIVITDKIDSLADDANQSMSQERRIVMDQLRTLEFVQLQAFARVLQQQNKKSQSTIDKIRQQTTHLPPAQLISESIKKHSLDKITFSLVIERILTKIDSLLSSLRDECYTSAVNNVQTLVQKDLGSTSMMIKIEQELTRQKLHVHHLTIINEKYNQLINRLIQDIHQIHDLAENHGKETMNIRSYIQSLYQTSYQHRFDRSECQILKRTSNLLELGFFDNLIRIQLEGNNIGRMEIWEKINDKTDFDVDCKISFSNDENLNSSQQFIYDLLKTEIINYWNRPLISTISVIYLIEFLRKLIEYSLITNNFLRTITVCLENLPCKLIENKFTIDWSTTKIRLDIEWEFDERIFRDCPLKSSYCCQPQHNGLCNELQILLDRMKPINGSIVSLYDQVEKHVRPWLKLLDNIQDEQENHQFESKISLTKLKQSLEQILIDKNM